MTNKDQKKVEAVTSQNNKEDKQPKDNWNVESPNKYWVRIIISEMIEEMKHEILMVSLRAKKPFTKKMIEDFIEGETTINNIKEVAKADDAELVFDYYIVNHEWEQE